MKLPIPNGGRMIISDDDPRAIKIRQGFEYKFQNGALIVTNKETRPNLSDLKVKLEKRTASLPELQQIVEYLLNKHLDSGKF